MMIPNKIVILSSRCLQQHESPSCKRMIHRKMESLLVHSNTIKTIRNNSSFAASSASSNGNEQNTTITTSLECICDRNPNVNTTNSTSSNNPLSLYNTLNHNTEYNIVFVRHGQSTWNRDNRFIGWTDTPLTDDGKLEAKIAGQLLMESNILFDEVHTSLLSRCIETSHIVLNEMKQHYIPIHKHYRLNERNYGNLVGYNKKEMVIQYGKDQIKRWRRSYDEPPPSMSYDHKYHPKNDIRYQNILNEIPDTESLKCTAKRSSVYWDDVIVPAIQSGKTVLVVGHENNLRSLLMKLDDISKDDIINLNIPRAVPLVYKLDPMTCKPIMNTQQQQNKNSDDVSTRMLRGSWLGGDSIVKSILQRDEKQVYDTSIQENLELHQRNKLNQKIILNNSTNNHDNNHNYFNAWMDTALGKSSSTSSI